MNVYSNSDCLCIHSKPVETKTNEIPVAQEILRMMDLKKQLLLLMLYIHKKKHVISLRQKRHLCSACKRQSVRFARRNFRKVQKYEKTPKKKITTLDTEKETLDLLVCHLIMMIVDSKE